MDEYDDFGYQVPLDYTEQSFAVPVERSSYAQDLKEAAQRSYNAARLASFGARGELSSDLEDINPLEDFDYNPAAVDYMRNVSDYITGNTTGYNLTPMNVGTNRDRQTGAMMPLTNAELEKFAASPLENQFYANFNYSDPKGWDVGNLQFAPNQQYRLIDRKTGDVVYSGTGYEAGKNISDLAKGMFEKSGQKADWLIQEAAPGSNEWTQRYEHKPDNNALADIVGTALPIAVGFIPGLQGVGAVLASAGAGGVGAAIRGQDILKGALMGGLSAAGGQYLGDAITGATNIGANAARAIGTGIGSTAGGVVTGQDFGNALLGGIASGGLSYLGGEIMKPGARTTTGGDTSGGGTGGGGSGGGLDPNAITVTGTRLANLAAPSVNLGGAKPPVAKSTETLDPDEIIVTGGRTPALTSSTFSVPGLTPLPKEITDLAAQSTEELPPAEDELPPAEDEIIATGERFANTGSANVNVGGGTLSPDEIVVTAAKKTPDADTGSSSFTVPTLTPLPAEITDLANQEDVAADEDTAKDEIIATGQRTADTGSATVGTSGSTPRPDEIVVTAKKTVDPETSSSVLTVPGVTPLPKEITDLAEKDTVAKDDKNKFNVKELLALLGLLGAGSGGGGGSGTGTGTGGKFQPIFSQKLPTPGKDGALMVGGLKGPTKGAAGTYSARPVTDWYRFGMGPAMDIPAGADLSRATSPYAGYGPGTLGEETFRAVSGIPAAPPEQPAGMAHGGSMGYARGSSRESFAVEGPGTGRSDDIPAVLSDGEYVIDAETVALLGDGSSKAGAKKLDQMRVNIRKHKGRNLAKGKFSVNAKAPERYLSGGRA